MLFEDLYDAVLRRYRASPPKIEQERQVRGRLYELLDATREVREGQEKKIQEDKRKTKNPTE